MVEWENDMYNYVTNKVIEDWTRFKSNCGSKIMSIDSVVNVPDDLDTDDAFFTPKLIGVLDIIGLTVEDRPAIKGQIQFYAGRYEVYVRSRMWSNLNVPFESVACINFDGKEEDELTVPNLIGVEDWFLANKDSIKDDVELKED